MAGIAKRIGACARYNRDARLKPTVPGTPGPIGANSFVVQMDPRTRLTIYLIQARGQVLAEVGSSDPTPHD